MRVSIRFAILAALAGLPAAALAQTIPVDVEVGYRFVNVDGNEQMYRTQVNEREGLLLNHLDLSLVGSDLGSGSGLFDNLSLHATELGAGPGGMLRLNAKKDDAYTFSLRYMRSELYSALPGFANPFAADGIIPGEHTENRTRNMVDADLRLLPGSVIEPIVGYTYNRDSGPGTTTYHVGQDEFRLGQDWSSTEHEIRVGAAFHAGPIDGEVTQGWRKDSESSSDFLLPGAGDGNNPGTVLGVPVNLTDLSRHQDLDVNTPVTRATVTGNFGDRVKVVAGYYRAAAESDTVEKESLAGDLVAFEISRFYSGLDESSITRARNKAWRASGRIEASILPQLDVVAGYEYRHRELDGYALVSDIFLDSTTFAGQDPRDFLKLLEANTGLERSDKIADVYLVGRPLTGLTLRAGFEQTNEDLTVTPDASEIVVPDGNGGDFSRRIRAYSGGAMFSRGGFRFSGDFRHESADDAVLRVDFLDRNRTRLRAGWSGVKWLDVSITGEQTDAYNDTTSIGYNGRTRQYGADLAVRPAAVLEVRGSAMVFDADSKVTIRQPQDFSLDRSLYSEYGREYAAGASLNLSPVHVDGNYMRMRNEGSFPFALDRISVRAGYDVVKAWTLGFEWLRDKYRENNADGIAHLGNFDADRYGVSIRWHP
jgi:hypothetical protein